MSQAHRAVGRPGLALLVLAGTCLTPGLLAAAELPSLTLSVPAGEYLVGEPVVASLRLRNEASGTPGVFTSNEGFATTGHFVFAFAGENGALAGETELHGAHVGRIGARLGPPLEAGASWQCDKMFLPQSGAATPRGEKRAPLKAGRYVLTAKLWWAPPRRYGEPAPREPQGVYISSNPVSVRIKEPAGAEAEALALLRSANLADFYSGMSGGKPQVIAELLAKHPDTTYAHHAKVRLLVDRMAWFWNTKRRGLSESERTEVRGLVEQAEGHELPPKLAPLKDNLLLLRARMREVLDEERAADRGQE